MPPMPLHIAHFPHIPYSLLVTSFYSHVSSCSCFPDSYLTTHLHYSPLWAVALCLSAASLDFCVPRALVTCFPRLVASFRLSATSSHHSYQQLPAAGGCSPLCCRRWLSSAIDQHSEIIVFVCCIGIQRRCNCCSQLVVLSFSRVRLQSEQ